MIRTQAGFHRLSFMNIEQPERGWPVLLEIAALKSGTHLLDQILTGFSRVSPVSPRALYLKSYNHQTGALDDTPSIVHALDKYRPLEVVKAHLTSDAELAKYIASANFLTYFIYRDPRDVLVSLAYYGFIEADPETKLTFRSLSMEQRINQLVVGANFGQFRFIGIDPFYRQFVGWLDWPFLLGIRYEDLIHDRRRTIQKIVNHFLQRVDTLPASPEQLAWALESNIDPKRSPTFRRGATGDWKTHFTAQHKKLFKEHAGDLLIQLGYEKDRDW